MFIFDYDTEDEFYVQNSIQNDDTEVIYLMKDNGDIVSFLKTKNYTMMNNALGKGSFGKTVLLQDPFIDELFVAKKYEPDTDDEEIKARFYKNFLDEIKILYKLNHRNVVRIYNYYAYEELSTGYILMEYIDGQRISDFISEYLNSIPTASITIDDIFSQLVDGFQYIENHGIIHRDIREGNILVEKTGTVRIIDFGIGKIIKKGDTVTDSLGNEINRADSDTLPQEYYEGVYTSRTDMFYLGELLHRLISNAGGIDVLDFSHSDILKKMMQKNPHNRYTSFTEIKEAINKHDFLNMDISQMDKDIYQNFTNAVYEALDSFSNEKKFNFDISYFVSKLEKVLVDNCFEDKIQDNSELIRSVVIGGYSYSPKQFIYCAVIKEFVEWFKNATPQSQKLIFNNIITKLSMKKIRIDVDVPF